MVDLTHVTQESRKTHEKGLEGGKIRDEFKL